MAIYFHMGFTDESAVQNPEKLYKERKLMIPLVISVLLMAVLLTIRIPYLDKWFSPTQEFMEHQAAIPGGGTGSHSDH
jgi:predicted ferric reductase